MLKTKAMSERASHFSILAVVGPWLALTLLSGVVFGKAPRASNVLFIAVDDLACTLDCYGDPIAKTPNIDRLASTGVCFLNAYNQIPLCNPSRASIMTGLCPDKLTVYDLDRHFREQVPDVVTLPQQFKQRGIFTARVGKIYHYNVPAGIGTDGLDDPASWMVAINPSGRDREDESKVVNSQPGRPISAALSWLAADGDDTEQTDGMVATEAIRMMREHRTEPFFIAAGFFRPHTPYIAPRKYFELYPLESLRLPYAPPGDRDDIPPAGFAHNCPIPNYGLEEPVLLQALQAYYASVSFIDAQVGRLLDALDELQLTDNTLVVLWSDHGYHLGEHSGIWQKRTLFEQCAKAPLIMRLPGAAGNGQSCRRIVEFLDIYPTIMDCVHFEAKTKLDGRSLAPLLQSADREWDGFAVTQILRPADNRLPAQVMGRSIRTDRWRYTDWNSGEVGEELYDHWADPMEFQNLANTSEAALQELKQSLQKKLQARAIGVPPKTAVNPSRL